MRSAILDTGPIVAYLCPKDGHHQWAREAFSRLPAGVITCESVLTEACHLVGKAGVPRAKVIEFVARGRLKVASLANELGVIQEMLRRYSDAPMDFADGCVLRLAEIHTDALVCTVDSDFSFYRKHDGEALELLAPFVS